MKHSCRLGPQSDLGLGCAALKSVSLIARKTNKWVHFASAPLAAFFRLKKGFGRTLQICAFRTGQLGTLLYLCTLFKPLVWYTLDLCTSTFNPTQIAKHLPRSAASFCVRCSSRCSFTRLCEATKMKCSPIFSLTKVTQTKSRAKQDVCSPDHEALYKCSSTAELYVQVPAHRLHIEGTIQDSKTRRFAPKKKGVHISRRTNPTRAEDDKFIQTT